MEYRLLLYNNTVYKDSRIYNLNPEIDDDLLCLNVRLQFSSEDVRAKHSRLLPLNDKRFKVKPGTQTVAPLPLDRIQEHPPDVSNDLYLVKDCIPIMIRLLKGLSVKKWWKRIDNNEVKNEFASKGIV
ncbi:integrase catalytic domain-containing protein [Nephila pilipes]|uniref:Integrase catalytic domain-containing protein n=1 Tax=Nephila pilipes TaxID=299642 RepID=A0A8X6TK68_NEPPI|nr:integrase catalytic domain-containing protein [Nephila pilipes]